MGIKNKLSILLTVAICFMFAASAGAVSITAVQTLDSAFMQRTTYSNTETITFKIAIYNDTFSSTVNFKFYVYDPNGAQVFYQDGNSMPGTIGMGGTELRNIPMSFYTKPGNYKFKGEAITAEGVTVSNTAMFNITSSNISLTYPYDGARDILAQPLIFSWSGSGATKYKIHVGDNASFYRPLWTSESYTTQIEYPRDPSDQMAKLKSGPVYYWKVDGLDSMDRVVAETRSPFSFTIKDATVMSSDLAVSDIILDERTTVDALMLGVLIKNLGNKTESNTSLDLVIVGGNIVPSQSINTIEASDTKTVVFNCGSLTGEAVTVSATLNIFDDNPKNNILTKVIRVPIKEKAKILGSVIEKGSKTKKVAEATIMFSGPASGIVKTNNGGEYKIENLALGDYSIKVTHPDYKDSEALTVTVSKHKAYPNTDFELELKAKEEEKKQEEKKEEAKRADITPQDMLNITKDLIKDKKVIDQFEGFNLTEIVLEPAGNIQDLFYMLKDKKATIVSYTVEEEKE
ncbi:MAG: hypothetical protein A2252_01245 [Elusimicrobia bacterium RIFOXYA2_FULL_39_19]|nr:MAG: hypothetical protein A2252_01245 [Elusimicrobia bacterium RIFOXYA2_FULL_39_19]